MLKVVIEPYGGRLYQPISELAQELDLSEDLIDALNKKWKGEMAQRKNLRKPTTPSKILKPAAGANSLCVKRTFKTQEI